MANVLVTGGAGYVGGALTDRLRATDHAVRVFDSLLYEESYRKPIPFFLGDVRDAAALQPHLDWADVVIWLAALVGDGACSLNHELAFDINRESVRYLVEHFGGRVLFPSTCSVYGAADALLVEESPVGPLSVYAESKLEAEKILDGKNALSFRLGTLFGISDTYSRIRMDLVVNVLTARAFKHGKIGVFGGEQYRPLLHVRDVAEAFVQNIETDHTGVYNLHAANMKIYDLACAIQGHFPEAEVEQTPMKFEDSRNYRVSSEKAVSTFGFDPQLRVDDGIEELQALFKDGRIKEIGISRHSNYHYLKEAGETLAAGGSKPWI